MLVKQIACVACVDCLEAFSWPCCAAEGSVSRLRVPCWAQLSLLSLQHDAQMDYYGTRLATCSSDRSVKIFDVRNGGQILIADLRGWDVTTGEVNQGKTLMLCPFALRQHKVQVEFRGELLQDCAEQLRAGAGTEPQWGTQWGLVIHLILCTCDFQEVKCTDTSWNCFLWQWEPCVRALPLPS